MLFLPLLLSLAPFISASPLTSGVLEKRLTANCTAVKAASGGKNSPGLGKPANANCVVPTKDIDDKEFGLQVGTINNWAGGRIPPGFRGIWYMEGNPNSGSECFSTGTAVFNTTTYALEINQYAPKTWSTDVGSNLLSRTLKDGTVVQSICTQNGGGYLRCGVNLWKRRNNEITGLGDYDALQYAKDWWIRESNVPNTPLMPGSTKTWIRYKYNLWRIVDENGQRTDKYYSRYLPNIGKKMGANTGQINVHLGEYQEVPNRR